MLLGVLIFFPPFIDVPAPLVSAFRLFLFLKDFFKKICFIYVNTLSQSDPITEGCKPPCGCWELNSGPLEEQPVLLTAEPSLQPWLYHFLTLYGSPVIALGLGL